MLRIAGSALDVGPDLARIGADESCVVMFAVKSGGMIVVGILEESMQRLLKSTGDPLL